MRPGRHLRRTSQSAIARSPCSSLRNSSSHKVDQEPCRGGTRKPAGREEGAVLPCGALSCGGQGSACRRGLQPTRTKVLAIATCRGWLAAKRQGRSEGQRGSAAPGARCAGLRPSLRSLVLDGVAARVAPTRAWEAFGEARGGNPSEPRGYTRAATARATPKGWGVTCMYVYLTKQRVSKVKPGQLSETSL
jgi:hypothetical protein